MQRDTAEVNDQVPFWCGIPSTGLVAGLFPTAVLMVQLWQLMETING